MYVYVHIYIYIYIYIYIHIYIYIYIYMYIYISGINERGREDSVAQHVEGRARRTRIKKIRWNVMRFPGVSILCKDNYCGQ